MCNNASIWRTSEMKLIEKLQTATIKKTCFRVGSCSGTPVPNAHKKRAPQNAMLF
jgi:hypothetical protein